MRNKSHRPSILLPVLAVAAIPLIAGCSDDSVAPANHTALEVVRTRPSRDESNIVLTTPIEIEFQRQVQPGEFPSNAFTINGQPLAVGAVHGASVTLQPPSDLEFNHYYTILVDRTAWGSAPGAPASNYSWRFSTDPGPPGLTWSRVDAGTTVNLNSITYGANDGFYVAGNDSTLLFSAQGDSWTRREYSVPATDLARVYRRGGSLALLIAASGQIYVSYGGLAWSAWAPPGVLNFTTRAMDVGPTWVMVGTHSDGSNAGVLVWWDGHSVTTTALQPGEWLSGVWWAASQVIAVGAHGTILWSTDGHLWYPATVPTDAIDFSEVAGHDENAPSRYVAVGSRVMFSDSGHAWGLSGFLPPAMLHDVIWTGERFVTVGEAGTVASSTDGVDWTLHDAGTSASLLGVATGGGRWVVVGAQGTILVTPAVTPR
jgi:hypothetical protein